jgi:hypothetical protein
MSANVGMEKLARSTSVGSWEGLTRSKHSVSTNKEISGFSFVVLKYLDVTLYAGRTLATEFTPVLFPSHMGPKLSFHGTGMIE